MRNFFINFFLFVALNSFLAGIPNQPIKNNQLSFQENKGQVSDQNYKPRPDVLFSGNANGMIYHLKENGISYQLYKVESWKENENDPHALIPGEKRTEKVPDQYSIYRLDVNWLNTNKNASIQKGESFNGYDNYYLAVCPDGVTNVRSYNDITYKNIYNGIDLHYYSKDESLKYDYIVKPGADYSKIQLEVKGADKITLQKDGSIILKTSLGEIQEGAPVAFQNGKRLNVKWIVKNKVLGFKIKDYDSSQELIIDPPTRIWGTYYGGTGVEESRFCINDKAGDVYMCGFTDCTISNVIATSGSYQSTIAGNADAFLAKFDGSGSRIWGTYFGGVGGDKGYHCSKDLSGNIYIGGVTSSISGISTTGSHQTVNNGGFFDSFLVKFTSSGMRLWGTYYGDSGNEDAISCTNDKKGNVYLSGYTSLPTMGVIPSSGSHQSSYAGGNKDGFLVKFDSTGLRLWATYFGDTGDDYLRCCYADTNANIYIAGYTQAATGTMIATPGSYQSTPGTLTGLEAYLVKFSENGVRQWGTYYSGNSGSFGWTCTTDLLNNVYLGGLANSSVSIATSGAHQTTISTGGDGFIVKFNSNGVRQWGTYYGGSGYDIVYGCKTDMAGNVFIVGNTLSSTTTNIADPSSYQSSWGGGGDAFLAKFTGTGIRQWGTYYGDTMDENFYACTIDNAGNIYATGVTNSTITTLVSVGSHQPNYGGGTYDGYLVKFFDCLTPTAPVNTTPSFNLNICAGNSATLSATATSTVDWYSSVTSTVILTSGSSYITPTLTAGTYTYYAETTNTCSASPRTPVTITVNPTPTVNISSTATIICAGQTATITVAGSGVVSYTWSTSATSSAIVVSPTVTTNYLIIGTDANGCNVGAAFTQSVSTCAGINEYNANNIKISPNPSNGEILISLNIKENDLLVEIYNSLGQLTNQIKLTEQNTKINLSDNANGIYFIKINDNSRSVYTKKIIKE